MWRCVGACVSGCWLHGARVLVSRSVGAAPSPEQLQISLFLLTLSSRECRPFILSLGSACGIVLPWGIRKVTREPTRALRVVYGLAQAARGTPNAKHRQECRKTTSKQSVNECFAVSWCKASLLAIQHNVHARFRPPSHQERLNRCKVQNLPFLVCVFLLCACVHAPFGRMCSVG